ncbi:hypothetical protein ACQ86B_24050 [Mycolicibacterium aichiense]|uniref:hypothetical protein n=1 Tax=Mycolicibacterium aichiense TaxID=1799 RepID=UPI003D67136F
MTLLDRCRGEATVVADVVVVRQHVAVVEWWKFDCRRPHVLTRDEQIRAYDTLARYGLDAGHDDIRFYSLIFRVVAVRIQCGSGRPITCADRVSSECPTECVDLVALLVRIGSYRRFGAITVGDLGRRVVECGGEVPIGRICVPQEVDNRIVDDLEVPLVFGLLLRVGRVKALERAVRYVDRYPPPVGHSLDAGPLRLDGLHVGRHGRDITPCLVAFVGVLKEAVADHLCPSGGRLLRGALPFQFRDDRALVVGDVAKVSRAITRCGSDPANGPRVPPVQIRERNPHSQQTYCCLGAAGIHSAATSRSTLARESARGGHAGVDLGVETPPGNKSATPAVDQFDNLSDIDSTLA